MPDDLITQDEVKQIKENPAHLSFNCVEEKQKANFFTLKSGYRVGYSIDFHRDGSQLAHISISRPGSVPDPADEEHIAMAVLGPGYGLSCVYMGVSQYTKLLIGGDKVEKNMVRGRRIEVR